MASETRRASATENETQLWGLNAPESIEDVEEVFETLVQNYPILVRGVLHSTQDKQLQMIAQKLIESYPVFVRGVIEACMENDFQDIEEEFEQEEGASNTRSASHRGQVTNPSDDKRLKQNRGSRYGRSGRSRSSASH